MHCHTQTVQMLVPSAVLTASLLGSGHCAFMCGGLVAVAARTRLQQAAYHLSRLSGYFLTGWISGLIGKHVSLYFPKGFSELIAVWIGISFVAIGIAGMKSGWHFSFPWTEKINHFTGKIFRNLQQSQSGGQLRYPALIGFLSIFLPCGWLYSFILAAVSMANPLKGALFMLLFGAGTLPALIFSPWLLRGVLQRIQGAAPRLASILLILAGILPILIRYAEAR